MNRFINILWGLLVFSSVYAQQRKGIDFEREIAIHRAEYKADFLKTESAPLGEDDLQYLQFFQPNPNYRIVARYEATPDARPFEMATYSGITKPYIQYGWLNFSIDGKPYRLAIYQSLKLRVLPQYRDHLFLPFKDNTNGGLTYGGGRYLDFETGDIKNGQILLDFNKAYNPWCAYSDGYNCPIPPKINHLEIGIPAGEKNYTHHKD